MGNIVLSLVVLMSTNDVVAHNSPNMYNCSDAKHKIELHYSTTSINGEPTFSYARSIGGKKDRKVNVRGAAEIRSEEVEFGSIVTVFDNSRSMPDQSTASVSLIVPDINLISNKDRAEFETVIVETIHHTSIGGPKLVNGPIQSSQYYPVKCSSSIVMF